VIVSSSLFHLISTSRHFPPECPAGEVPLSQNGTIDPDGGRLQPGKGQNEQGTSPSQLFRVLPLTRIQKKLFVTLMDRGSASQLDRLQRKSFNVQAAVETPSDASWASWSSHASGFASPLCVAAEDAVA
jgi:hypothetical protein